MNLLTQLSGLSRNQKVGIFIISCAIIGGAAVALTGGIQRFAPQTDYQEIYSLVPNTLSEHATVPVQLPEGASLSIQEAEKAVVFTPPLKGTWKPGTLKNTLLFEPSENLTRGAEYTVALTLPEGTLEKNFRVDEDPKVLSVFPKPDAEAPENSAISIMFNRPMVPLTTLDELAKKDIPVAITPPTKGTFKWISTRVLQFIPETRLTRSQHYAVKIGKGLISLDGLEVPPAEFNFRTTNFRFEGNTIHHEGNTLHSEPVLIRFNQPIDLESTKSRVSVIGPAGTTIPFIAEYGSRSVYNDKTRKNEEFIDKSILAIYNAKDSRGREKMWDAQKSYSISLSGAVQVEGDIGTTETRNITISVPSYISHISATSPRSKLVSRDLFDPQGTLEVHFFEDIDKEASSISAPGLAKIEYGEKCEQTDPNDYYYYRSDCKKVTDKATLILSFNPNQFSLGQTFAIEFRKLVDSHGITINPAVLTENIKTYPVSQVFSTAPTVNQPGASVREMRLCTATPLQQPGDSEFYTKVTSNATLGKWNWGPSYLVAPNEYRQSKCSVGQFETTIYYGLQPETNYSLNLNLEDDFGQPITHKVSFTTEPIQSIYRTLSPLQKEYNVTSPDKTKLTFGAENLEYVDAHICKVSAETMLNYLSGYNTKPSIQTPGESLPCIQTITQRIELPKVYWKRNYFQIDISQILGADSLGHYILTLSHPDLRTTTYDYRSQQTIPGVRIYPHSFLTITKLAIGAKTINASGYEAPTENSGHMLAKTSGDLYWVSEIGTLKPVSGAKVSTYQVSYSVNSNTPRVTLASTALTGTDGIARTSVGTDIQGAIVTTGNDSAIVSGQYDKFQWGYGDQPALRTYLYTDRPIYRPGDEVFFKGLTRLGYDGDYEIWREKPVIADIYDPQGESLGKQTLQISEYGTFSGSVKLPADAALGSYRIETSGGTGYFDVEEYKPAAFKVEMQATKEEFVAGDTLAVNLSADYYFGVPIEKGEVEYSIVSQDYYFDRYTDRYFNFGSGWYYSSYGGYGDSFVTRGKATLDQKGKTTISQKLDFNTLFKDDARNRSKIFVVRATVRNSTGQSISSEKSFIVHRSEVYLGAITDTPYFGKGQSTTIGLKSVDTTGKEIGLRGITGEVYRITWDYFKRQEVDGRFYYSSEEKKELVDSFSIATDTRGNASRSYTPDKEGEYRVVLKAKDGRGNPIETSTSFYVYGSGSVSVKPTNNETLDLVVTKNSLKVGEVGSFVVSSPYKTAKALITLERGQIFDYKIVDINQNLFNYSFAVGEEYIPNVYASVMLLSPDPEVKYGQANFQINTQEKELSISVKTDKNNYLPGEEVTMTLETKNSKGQPIPAEVSVSVADLSVLALKGNPKKNPIAFFYGGLPLAVNTSSNIKNALEEAEIPTGTKGGSGLSAAELAKKKRGLFKDTAFWNATIRTGTSGITTFSFRLPDNLTTWQAEAVGITTDTTVGSAYSELISKKLVSLTPLVPRFIVPGDRFMAGAKIINDTDSSERLSVTVQSPDITLADTTQTITVPAHGTETVYFEATAPQNPTKENLSLNLTAQNSTYTDSVDQAIPVGKTSFFETTATASFSTDPIIKEFVYVPDSVLKHQGGLTVTAESSLIPYMGDALRYLIQYPYGCSEQVADKIAAIAILKRHAAEEGKKLGELGTITFEGQEYSPDDLVKIGLQKILANQNTDGGFAYYQGFKSNYSLTLAVLEALQAVKASGYTVSTHVLQNAGNFVYQAMNSTTDYRIGREGIVMGIEALTRIGGVWNQEPYRTYFNSLIVGIATDRGYMYDKASNSIVATLALLTTRGYAAAQSAQLFGILENRLTINARGSYITSGTDNRLYDYYETAEKNTALYLKALIAARKDSPVEDGLLRWLIARKTKANGWGTTNATLAVLDALSDFVAARKEKDTSYTLSLVLGEKEILPSTQFPEKDGITRSEVKVSIDDIKKNTIIPLAFTKIDSGKTPGTVYYSAELNYALPTEKLAPRDEGFLISRELYAKDDTEYTRLVTSAKAGEVLRGHITLTVPKDRTLVAVEDYIPAGMELVNLNLATEDQTLNDSPRYDGFRGSRGGIGNLAAGIFGFGSQELPDSAYGPQTWNIKLYPDTVEIHDDRLFLFKEHLAPGVYSFDYYVRALIPGTYNHLPAVASQLYAPEVFGRTKGALFTITQ